MNNQGRWYRALFLGMSWTLLCQAPLLADSPYPDGIDPGLRRSAEEAKRLSNPDLEVIGLGAFPNIPAKHCNLSVTIKNHGQSALPTSDFSQIYLTLDNPQTTITLDRIDSNRRLANAPPQTASSSWPSYAFTGTQTFKVSVDTTNHISEVNESDNSKQQTLTCKIPKAASLGLRKPELERDPNPSLRRPGAGPDPSPIETPTPMDLSPGSLDPRLPSTR